MMSIVTERANSGTAAADVAERIMIAPHAFALYLDLDGTLLDIAARPDEVEVAPGLASDLERLRRGLAGALAIVSGRTLVDIDRFLRPIRFDAAAEHGSTLRFADGDGEGMHSAELDASVVAAVEAAAGAFEGVMLERKRSALAVHYRSAPHTAALLSSALDRILARSNADIRLIPGRCVFELTPARASKAGAVEHFLSLAPFAGRWPIVIGDDASDEEAGVLAERAGGVALAVAGEYFARDRAAFDGPAQVRRWIATLATRLDAADRGCRR